MWRKPVVHLRDIRLYNNAGMRFPVCHASARLLDLDKSGLRMDTDEKVTCIRCAKKAIKRYSWAYVAEDFLLLQDKFTKKQLTKG